MGIEVTISLCIKKQHLVAYKLLGDINKIFKYNLVLLAEKKMFFTFY